MDDTQRTRGADVPVVSRGASFTICQISPEKWSSGPRQEHLIQARREWRRQRPVSSVRRSTRHGFCQTPTQLGDREQRRRGARRGRERRRWKISDVTAVWTCHKTIHILSVLRSHFYSHDFSPFSPEPGVEFGHFEIWAVRQTALSTLKDRLSGVG